MPPSVRRYLRRSFLERAGRSSHDLGTAVTTSSHTSYAPPNSSSASVSCARCNVAMMTLSARCSSSSLRKRCMGAPTLLGSFGASSGPEGARRRRTCSSGAAPPSPGGATPWMVRWRHLAAFEKLPPGVVKSTASSSSRLAIALLTTLMSAAYHVRYTRPTSPARSAARDGHASRTCCTSLEENGMVR